MKAKPREQKTNAHSLEWLTHLSMDALMICGRYAALGLQTYRNGVETVSLHKTVSKVDAAQHHQPITLVDGSSYDSETSGQLKTLKQMLAQRSQHADHDEDWATA
ncbi:hypothetical protein MAIT1_03576 [Magnetofaba australis IT-1]|uniref:Uncharacterized protein n=2 Tax=Magnetofaba TaxID=1472292 RepID=A0A1Y2K4F6_9PROT|nr:hypothetical protein MAIT1_03576 [Magnetofaba australis IT-1]